MTATLQIKKDRPNYYVLIRYRDGTTGNERQKWVTTDVPVKGNNKRKAEKYKDEILARYIADKSDIGKDPYFLEYIGDWLETQKSAKKIAVTTYEAYMLTLDTHIKPYFIPLNLRIKEVEPRHLQGYADEKLKKLSPNTVRKHFAILTKCFDGAVRRNIVPFNPAKRIDEIKKIKYTGARFLAEDQIERLLGCLNDDPLRIVIPLTLFYGLTRSEVLGLKWDAVDFKRETLAIRHTVVKVGNVIHYLDATKNESRNDEFSLPKAIKTCLLTWKDRQERNRALQPNDYFESGYICTLTDGSLIKPDYVSSHFKNLLVKNGLPVVRFHDLRHSSASYLKYLGFDLKDIQSWLRHADIQTSMNMYTHLYSEAKKGMADKLDEKLGKMIKNV